MLIIALVICFVPLVQEYSRIIGVEEKLRYESVPLLTEDNVVSRLDELSQKISAPVSDDPAEYYRILVFYYETKDMVLKFIQHHDNPKYRYLVGRLGFYGNLNEAQEKYRDEYGTVMFSSELRNSVMDDYSKPVVSLGSTNIESQTGELFLSGYIQSIAVMGLLFLVRLRRKGLIVWVEFFTKLIPYALIWPVTMWKYPSAIVRSDQLRIARKIVGCAVSILLSVIPITGMTKMADKKLSKSSDTSLETGGFVQNVHGTNLSPEYQWRTARMNAKLDSTSSFSIVGEVELVNASLPNSNWLRKLYVQNEIDSWKVRFGRLFLGAGHSSPPPFLLKTVNYPSGPYSVYGWGVQVQGDIAKNVSLIFDLGTKSGVSFDSPEANDDMEVSGRIEYQSGDIAVASAAQIGAEFTRMSLEGSYRLSKLSQVKSFIYSAREGPVFKKGGHALISWKPLSSFELHSQLDIQRTEAFSGKTLTTGFSWFVNKIMTLTLDYEKEIEESEEDQILLRLQYQL